MLYAHSKPKRQPPGPLRCYLLLDSRHSISQHSSSTTVGSGEQLMQPCSKQARHEEDKELDIPSLLQVGLVQTPHINPQQLLHNSSMTRGMPCSAGTARNHRQHLSSAAIKPQPYQHEAASACSPHARLSTVQACVSTRQPSDNPTPPACEPEQQAAFLQWQDWQRRQRAAAWRQHRAAGTRQQGSWTAARSLHRAAERACLQLAGSLSAQGRCCSLCSKQPSWRSTRRAAAGQGATSAHMAAW